MQRAGGFAVEAQGLVKEFGSERALDEVHRAVSLTGQFSSVDTDLTGRENLMLVGRLLGFGRAQAKARSTELLESLGLVGAADRRVADDPGGMGRRRDIPP